MTAFETETVEKLPFAGQGSGDIFRPISLVELLPECASSGYRELGLGSWGG
jgi:hypothetical protein